MFSRLRGIGIIPAVVITCIALVALVNLGFLIKRIVNNGGLMPRPTTMQTYVCKGFAEPFSLDFRHGMDSVQLHKQGVLLDGNLLNGKIVWIGLPAVAAQLGFVPPTEITYDDSSSLRVLDSGQVERICQRAQ
jgi:hypothetical protein